MEKEKCDKCKGENGKINLCLDCYMDLQMSLNDLKIELKDLKKEKEELLEDIKNR